MCRGGMERSSWEVPTCISTSCFEILKPSPSPPGRRVPRLGLNVDFDAHASRVGGRQHRLDGIDDDIEYLNPLRVHVTENRVQQRAQLARQGREKFVLHRRRNVSKCSMRSPRVSVAISASSVIAAIAATRAALSS